MIKSVTFMSRADMKNKLKLEDFPFRSVVISINDTEDELHEMNEMLENSTVDAHVVWMLDDDNSDQVCSLGQMLHYVHEMIEWERPEHVFVHCAMGISRSAAIAKYINDKYDLKDKRLENYTRYNIDIYNQLCNIGGVETMRDYYSKLECE